MPIPFLNSIKLNKNQVEDFCVYNISPDPTLTSAGDFGYLWLNTSDSPKTLKWWDGANIRSLVDSTNISSFTAGLATDLAGGGAGQVVYQNGSNDTQFLAAGTAGQVLSSNGSSAPSWLNQSSLSVGSATALNGGANGSIAVQSGVGTTGFLSVGTAGQVITSNGTTPQYVDQSSLSVGSATTAGSVANALTAGNYLTSTGTYDGSAARTFNVDATDANTASKVVARDASGNFAAGTITAATVTGLSAPTLGSDATNKDYVDGVVQGLDIKASCLVATTTDITLSAPGAITIDGVVASTDFTTGVTRILVKDQSAPAENGIYIWQGPAAAMTRSADANTWDELVAAFTFIERGTANADSGWVCNVNAGGTLGTTAVTWTKFSQAGSYTAGNGMVLSGGAFSFAQSSAYTAGQIPFASSTSAIGFSSNLFWDNSNNRLGIGTATPQLKLVVSNAGAQGFEVNPNSGSYAGGIDLLCYNRTTSAYKPFALFAESFAWNTATTGSPSEKMVLNSSGYLYTAANGRIGVGVVPLFDLHVERAGQAELRLKNTSGSGLAAISLIGGSQTNPWYIYTDASRNFIFQDSTTERLRIDSSGNVNIGTVPSINSGKVSVYQAAAGQCFVAQVSNNGYSNFQGFNSSGTATFYATGDGDVSLASITRYGTAALPFNVNGLERLRIDSSGNLGLGVTPSAWTLAAFQSAYGIYSGTTEFNTSANAYYNSGWKYIASATASRYSHAAGVHYWYTAGSGTAGNAITWTQAMTLDASGRLIRGAATADTLITDAATMVNIGNFAVQYAATTGNYFAVKPGAPLGTVDLLADARSGAYPNLRIFTGGSANLTLDTSGNLGLGVTPSAWSGIGPVLQVEQASLVSEASNQLYLTANAYFASGNWNYINNSQASQYYQAGGAHVWRSAAASTGIVSFTPHMTLDASGRLILGVTSVPDTGLSFYNGNGTVGIGQYLTPNVGYIGTWTNHPLGLATNGTERLRIKSTGQLNFTGLATDPAGAAGDLYYSTGNYFKWHNGTAWQTFPRKYVVQLSDGSVTVVGNAYTLTHNLGSKDVTVTIRRTTDDAVILADVTMPSTTTATITFAAAITAANFYVTVIG